MIHQKGKARSGRATVKNTLKTVVILLAGLVLSEIFYHFDFGEQNTNIIMVLAVFMVAAITDGYVYGVVSTVIAVFIYDFLITQPRFGFSFQLGFPVTLSIMLLVTLCTSTVTTNLKKKMETAKEKEKQAELVYNINRQLLSLQDEAEMADCILGFINEGMQRSAALFSGSGEETGFYFLQARADVPAGFFSAPGQVASAGLAAAGTDPIETGGENGGAYFYPVIWQEKQLAVIGISCAKGPLTDKERDFAKLMGEQAGMALRVQQMAEEKQQSKIMAETEKDRNSFLRSISHDLKTPLTSIIGASDTLLENTAGLSPEKAHQLLADIRHEAQWLLSMVENVLSITRIQSKGMTIYKSEEAAEEVVGEAVSAFRTRFPGTDITIRQPDELMLVPMDALLISQVITNLLDNSQRHAAGMEAKVAIEMQQKNGYALFSITDTGPGINAATLPRLFEIIPDSGQEREDASRGHGMGLSICKSIVEVHGGWIKAMNIMPHGARFIFALPLDKEEAV